MAAASGPTSRSHILKEGGFIKESLNIVNDKAEKIRLYRLPDTKEETLKVAKEAIVKAISEKDRTYNNGKISQFYEKAKTHSYLLREGDTLQLLSKEEADRVLDQYGISGKEAQELSTSALDLLKEHNIKTGEDLIKLYNNSDEEKRKGLFPLFNIMLVIFQKNRPIQSVEEIKTITLFATCDNDAIRTAALDAMMQLFEADGFQNVDYGYGLKYLIDNLPPEFLNTNQLRLLTIFEKLTNKLDSLLHTGRTVNSEIEPLMAPLISISRATLNSELKGLAKGTKDNFYKRLKQFYYNEEYIKRVYSLSKEKNYLLEFESIWPLQHLVRVPSSEHKAVTFIRKTGHGLYAARKLAGAPAKAFVGLLTQGTLPDESIIPDLQAAYKHGKKAFGIKDIPRPWYDMLEHTEEALINPDVTEDTLESVYQVAIQYDQMSHAFNEVIAHNLKKVIGKDKDEVSLQENKEFAFGFVGQLSDLVMDHPIKTVRHKAIELLERIFLEDKQSKDVRVFILTTLENIIQKKDDTENTQKVQTLKGQLESHNPELKAIPPFRTSKYPCLTLLPDSPLLFKAAKQKLGRTSAGVTALPLSEFIFNPKIVTEYEELFVKKDLNITHMPVDYAIQLAQEARTQHAQHQQASQGKINISTRIESLTRVIVKGKTTVDGDLNIGFSPMKKV